MSRSVSSSLKICLVLSYGLMIGLAVELSQRMAIGAGDWPMKAAYFIAYTLFNTLLGGIVGGAVFSILVFPLHYFVIRLYNPVVLAIFFVLGFLSGSFGFHMMMLSLR